MQTIGFILPTYGQYDYARRAAESFRKNTTSAKPVIALIDDASPDGIDAFGELVNQIDADHSFRFSTNGGLTRSWNAGLDMLKYCDYIICGNSDLVFSKGWDYPVLDALRQYDLVGPLTNASGWGTPRQNVKFWQTYNLTDDQAAIDATQVDIYNADFRPVTLHLPGISFAQQGAILQVPEFLNGFCMVARSETWHTGKFDGNCVFNPANRMTENETELQMRWALLGRQSAIARSFVFHYRAITRGDKAMCEGAFRK